MKNQKAPAKPLTQAQLDYSKQLQTQQAQQLTKGPKQ